ncbi:adenine deaminase [Dyadobacter sandarakinus]|uniref:Adenine deaminase n=1 Tax=Dyadobacter sandarakinus TaxID=2747268 RepID=A0ABX7ICS9_9BACT|nr:adenine deaminase [Dyadobacter sandarakinus]QRR03917.1 adenine deaminase [Dyadobacter sandarakinus]
MRANIIDLFARQIHEATLTWTNGKIDHVEVHGPENTELQYILPGFVDAHVHIESAMLTPAQFARLAVVHGTVATVSDPHEIANVLGVEGVKYMVEDGKRVPFKFCFGAPSCVPATTFETAGAVIGPEEVGELLASDDIGYLAEVMNFPGVLQGEPDLMAKIEFAKQNNKVIDGHAPGLMGDAARQYASHGISTDHECFTYEEGFEKVELGVKILIREGSAARNFDALIPLLSQFPDEIMFCSDDKHPDNLVEGHINLLVKRALAHGCSLWDVLRAACVNPVLHYSLPVGLLCVNDPADFIVIDNPQDFNILQTYLSGELVADQGATLLPDLRSDHVNRFDCEPVTAEQLACKLPEDAENVKIRVIEALEGQLVTNELTYMSKTKDGLIVADPDADVLKVAVVNRYFSAEPAVGFIKNFGLKKGAIASSVAHDSHNIICVGCDDESMTAAINLIIEAKGGVSAAGNGETQLLPLPIAGLMSDVDGYEVAQCYTAIDLFAKEVLGATLQSPYMTLSFMALLVIPALKLSDKGLFDVKTFRHIPVSVE